MLSSFTDFLLNDINEMLFDDESYMNTDEGKLVPNPTSSIPANIKPVQVAHSPNPQLPVFKKEDTLSSFSYVSQEELPPKMVPMNHVYAPKVSPGGQIHSPNMYSLNQGQVTPLPPMNFMNSTKMSPLTPMSSPNMSPALMHSPKMSPVSHIGSMSPASLHSPGSHVGSPCPIDAQAHSPNMQQNSHPFSPTVSTMNEVQSPKVSSVINIMPPKVSVSGQVGIPQSYSTQSQPVKTKPMQQNASPKNPTIGNIKGYVVKNPTVMRQNNILLQGQVQNPTYVNFKSVTVPQQPKLVHHGDKETRSAKAVHGAPPQHQLLVTDKGMSPLLVQGADRRLAPVVLQAKHVKIEQQPRTLMYSTPVQGNYKIIPNLRNDFWFGLFP